MSVATLHSRAVERSRKSRKPAALPADVLPRWYPQLRALMQRLDYPYVNVAEARAHILTHGGVDGCPVVEPDDVAAINAVVDRNGRPEPTLGPLGSDVRPIVEAEDMPAASTPFTPIGSDVYIPSDREWAEFSAWLHGTDERPAPRPRPACRSRVVAGWSDADQIRAHGCV